MHPQVSARTQSSEACNGRLRMCFQAVSGHVLHACYFLVSMNQIEPDTNSQARDVIKLKHTSFEAQIAPYTPDNEFQGLSHVRSGVVWTRLCGREAATLK